MRKGQAAMEFLMTYGWAILVVIAAIAALAYFGVLSPANLLPQRCVGESGMDCLRKPIYVVDNGHAVSEVQFVIKNNQGFNINITDITHAETTGCGQVVYYNISIDGVQEDIVRPAVLGQFLRLENGKTAAIIIGCTEDLSAGRQSDDFVMSFTDEEAGTGFIQKVTYSMKGNAK